MDHDMIIPNILASITPKKNSASKCRCFQPTTIMGPQYQTWMPSIYCYPCHYQLPQYGFVRKLTKVGYPKIQWGIVVFPTGFTHCLARPSVVSGREPSSLVGNQRKCSKMSTWLGKWWSNDKPQDGMLNPIFRATHFHWLSRLHFFLKLGSNSPRGEVEVGPCPLGPGGLHLFGSSLVFGGYPWILAFELHIFIGWSFLAARLPKRWCTPSTGNVNPSTWSHLDFLPHIHVGLMHLCCLCAAETSSFQLWPSFRAPFFPMTAPGTTHFWAMLAYSISSLGIACAEDPPLWGASGPQVKDRWLHPPTRQTSCKVGSFVTVVSWGFWNFYQTLQPHNSNHFNRFNPGLVETLETLLNLTQPT